MFKKLLILPAAFLAFACSKGDNKMTAADSALNSDLMTAAASRPYTPLDSITAAERAGLMTAAAPTALRSTSAAPRTVVRTPVRRTSTRRSSSGGSYSSAPVYSAPAPQPRVVKHTKRDAAIGAGAGAVIGAVTSRNKVKGAIIGGAAGAILGGIIGNNVDKQTKY
ncbi:MAG: YMGG-like glycine zipper-containing protein [Gemmatimonadaceae bacterium]